MSFFDKIKDVVEEHKDLVRTRGDGLIASNLTGYGCLAITARGHSQGA
jgi:hypothetical protein